MAEIPSYAADILNILAGAGYQAVLAGGCVRDLLLGRRPADWDVASSASPAQVKALFPRTAATGEAHGTVTVLRGRGSCEVTSFRAESGYSDGRHPDAVRFTGDLAGDLSRRDFTVNAMALSADGTLTDLFGGRRDLERRLLRCVGDPRERFSEDALRMLRAFRFSAQLDFRIADDVRAAAAACAPLCRKLSAERVRDELSKTLMSPRPDAVWEMAEAGLLSAFLDPDRLPAGDARPVLGRVPRGGRWAGLCAALEASGAVPSARDLLTALRLDGETIRVSSRAAALLRGSSRDWKRLLRDNGEAAVRAAFPRSRGLSRTLRSGECWSLSGLALSGEDVRALGFSGPQVGRRLALALDHVIDHPEDNRKDILIQWIGGGEE